MLSATACLQTALLIYQHATAVPATHAHNLYCRTTRCTNDHKGDRCRFARAIHYQLAMQFKGSVAKLRKNFPCSFCGTYGTHFGCLCDNIGFVVMRTYNNTCTMSLCIMPFFGVQNTITKHWMPTACQPSINSNSWPVPVLCLGQQMLQGSAVISLPHLMPLIPQQSRKYTPVLVACP